MRLSGEPIQQRRGRGIARFSPPASMCGLRPFEKGRRSMAAFAGPTGNAYRNRATRGRDVGGG
jgi:hypothetical protein